MTAQKRDQILANKKIIIITSVSGLDCASGIIEFFNKCTHFPNIGVTFTADSFSALSSDYRIPICATCSDAHVLSANEIETLKHDIGLFEAGWHHRNSRK